MLKRYVSASLPNMSCEASTRNSATALLWQLLAITVTGVVVCSPANAAHPTQNLIPNASATIIHVFGSKQDGDHAQDMPAMNSKGVLYGTTPFGGANGVGVAYSLTPPHSGQPGWHEHVIYNFGNGGADSASPRSAISIGKKGVLTGTATDGGSSGSGTLFTLSPSSKITGPYGETIEWNFHGQNEGAFPEGVPVRGSGDVYYGATVGGGPKNAGTIYKVKYIQGKALITVIHSFNGSDGSGPGQDLIIDTEGNIYGQTTVGGPVDLGTIFRLSLGGGVWTLTTLHNFTGGVDGRAPGNRLYIDSSGVLWGTNPSGGPNQSGNIFTLSPPEQGHANWTFQNVYIADELSLAPSSGLVTDGTGGFYGTTGAGGPHKCGSIYHFEPSTRGGGPGKLTNLYEFSGGSNGGFPAGELLLTNGALYGVTFGIAEDYCMGSSVMFELPVNPSLKRVK